MGRGAPVDRGMRASRAAFEIGVMWQAGREQTRLVVDVVNARGALATTEYRQPAR